MYTLGLLQHEGADCTSVGVCDGHDRHASGAHAAFMMSIPARIVAEHTLCVAHA